MAAVFSFDDVWESSQRNSRVFTINREEKEHQAMSDAVQIRALSESDPDIISHAFRNIGWGKPATQYWRYLAEQADGSRICRVVTVAGQFAGYVTVNWKPPYSAFLELDIPEIQDLNVLPEFRRQGIGTRLLDWAEEAIALRSGTAGIGVGLHPGYNAAQRLYVKRGYVPDGRGELPTTIVMWRRECK
jgi:GNAT superfamily N-acetyltransferase